MERKFLESLGITGEVIDKVLDENSADIGKHKKLLDAAATERDTLKAQLADVQSQLKAFNGVDVADLQGKVKKLGDDLTAAQAAHAAELAKIKRQGETKDFMSGLQFVNEETRDYYFNKLESALDDDSNKGKSRKDILESFVNGEDGKPRPNIFAEEKQQPPPPYAAGTGTGHLLGNKKLSEMTYVEELAFKSQNPDLYSNMKGK